MPRNVLANHEGEIPYRSAMIETMVNASIKKAFFKFMIHLWKRR
jgi:hypothetical protein